MVSGPIAASVRLTTKLLPALALAATVACEAAPASVPLDRQSLIPLPATVTTAPGEIGLSCGTTFSIPESCPGCEQAAAGFTEEVVGDLGCDGALRRDSPASAGIVVELAPGAGPAGGYTLELGSDRVRLTGFDEDGVRHGFRTLRQLLPAGRGFDGKEWRLPAGRIVDQPRYAWRGVMLDVARHFFGVAEVKRLIDAMAAYKFNRLHLHLTDDQGWRIAIDGWPRLTEIGGATEVGGGPGGHYSAADYRKLVDHAAARGIMVVPEIDMPGHINAALASYGELTCDGEAPDPYTGTEVGISSLCVGEPEVTTFVADVIAEVARLTPGGMLHLGADEAYQTDHADYAAFVSRAFAEVRRHGMEPLGWEEAGEAEPDGDWTIQHWLLPGRVTRAVAAGARVVLSPFDRTYLSFPYEPGFGFGNTWAGFRDIDDAYGWDPATHIAGIEPDAVRGVEAAVWTERIETYRQVELALFPRLLATAEVAWSPQHRRTAADFRDRVARHAGRMTKLGIHYYRAKDIDWQAARPLP